jgi:cytochrome c553
VLDKCLTRFNIDWAWDGKPAIVQSRAMDETGYVQPSYRQLRVRGTRSIYHNNAIQSWLVQESGEVKNVQLRNAIAALLAAACVLPAAAQDRFPGIGRAATPAEVKAWDIDVRPTSRACPPARAASTRARIWEAKCASCHGVFGESNEVFNPLVGGTTKDDIKTGHVATLKRTDYPGRTT